jgi:hypothetical protein
VTTAVPHVPVTYDVRTLLEELFGRSVSVKQGPPWAPLNGEPGTVASYVDPRYVLRALVVCDVRFSAYAGAAIGLVPQRAAEAAVKERSLGQNLQENLHEVLDICAALHNVGSAPHLKLHRVHHVGPEVPRHLQALSAVLGRRLDLTVHIAGYGGGRVSFVGVV